MFCIDSVTDSGKGFWTARACCRTVSEAELIRASYIGPVRQISMFADLYCDKKELIIEGPDRETVEKIADILNNSAFA